MKKKEILQVFIDVLNEAHDLDPKAIESLMNTRTNCNDDLADHDSILCGTAMIVGCNIEMPTISTLGLLNGVCKRLTGKTVSNVFYDDMTIDRFQEYDPDFYLNTIHDDSEDGE